MAEYKGIIRGVDHLGRIVIPKEIRKQLEIEDGKDSLQMTFDQNGDLVLRKFSPSCIFCGKDSNLITFKEKLLCKECLFKLGDAAQENI